ncbi:MAG: Bug family tripartite tricarboxylate transporter substrate binding protein [Xanthobacteraceae bacterium]
MPRARILKQAAITGIVIALVATAAPALAQTESFPNHPIKIVVPFAAGTAVDITARRIGENIAPMLGQPIVVENKGGAGGTIGTDLVAKSPPDGYTLVLGTISTHAFNVSLYKSLSYDPLKDFAPITRTVIGGFNTLLVHPSFPANNMKEFIAVAKQRATDGKPLTFGSAGVGSPGQLLVELIKMSTGIQATHIPYKGSSLIVADVIGGHVDFFIAAPAVALPQVQGKMLKAIAVDSPERSAHLPEVPTMREIGIANVEAQIWVGLFAPANTPAEIVNKLHAAVTTVLAKPSVKAEFDKDGLVVETDPTPEAFRKIVADDIDKWARVIKAAGIQPE